MVSKWVVMIAVGVLAWSDPGAAQPYSGPPSSGTAYWEEPAFKDYPYRGPNGATGVLFWSHGVSGTAVQWKYPPPPIIRRLAQGGWDVVKVQRNNTHEGGWVTSGPKHVADLVERVKKAHDNGYKSIVVAGQSYGGAISLEAAGQTDLISAAIAFAPGHGSDACGPYTGSVGRISDNLPAQLVAAIEKVKVPRIVLSLADGDDCMFGRQQPSPMLEAALQKTGAKYIHFDDTMPIRGHGATETNQFDAWYGRCLVDFLSPAIAPAAGRTACPAPSNTKWLFLGDQTTERVPTDIKTQDDYVGMWSGELLADRSTRYNRTPICVVVEYIGDKQMVAAVSFGPGQRNDVSMSVTRRNLVRGDDGFVYVGTNKYRLELKPILADSSLQAHVTTTSGEVRYQAKLSPGC